MRIAQQQSGAERHELVHEEQAGLEHLLEHENHAVALCGDHHRNGGQIGGKRGPRSVLDLRNVPTQVGPDAALLTGLDHERRVIETRSYPKAIEREQDAPQIVRPGVGD